MNFDYEKHLVFKTHGGSIAYGTVTANSDVDLRGVIVPPPQYFFGLCQFEQYEAEDGDVTYFDIRKFIHLALKGNPASIELLWTNPIDGEDEFLLARPIIRKYCISKALAKPHMGMAQAHLARIDHPGKNAGEKGRIAIEKFGYNTKDASHVIRVLEQCKEILTTGNLTFPRPNAKDLLDIKLGRYSLQDIKDRSDTLFSELHKILDRNEWPEQPDFVQMQAWMMSYIPRILEIRKNEHQ